MNHQWLIEREVFDENLERLTTALKKYDIEYKIVKHSVFCEDESNEDYKSVRQIVSEYKNDDNVVFYGTVQLGNQLYRNTNWTGLFCDFSSFDCVNYYPKWHQYLLNTPYFMMPFGDIENQKETLLTLMGTGSEVFIRPTKGTKSFTGQLLTRENWTRDLNTISFYNPDPLELILASEPVNITREWRFVIVNKKVVACSLYKEDFKHVEEEGCPKEVKKYVTEVISEIKEPPAIAYTIDVGETRYLPYVYSRYSVIEINSFNCSGWYSANIEDIVLAIKELYDSCVHWT